MIQGHDESNDDLFDDAGTVATANARDNSFQWGGHGQLRNPKDTPYSHDPANGPAFMPGTSGAEQDVARYRAMGAADANRAGPTTNYGQADRYMGMGDQARGSQTDALGMMQSAAQGNAPSQAAILMRQGNDQAIASQLSMAAGARGPAAMAGAQQQAMGNASAMSTTNQNNMGALRAQEMANARNSYMQGASGMRAGDLAAQGQNAQQAQYLSSLEMQQRGLNQQGQHDYEHMGYDVNDAQLRANAGLEDANINRWKTQGGWDQHSHEMEDKNATAGGGFFGSLLGGVGLSDARTKQNVQAEGFAKGMEMQFGSPGVAAKAAKEVDRSESHQKPANAAAQEAGVQAAQSIQTPNHIYRGELGSPEMTYGTKGEHDATTLLRGVGRGIANGAQAYANWQPRTASEAMLEQTQPYSYNYRPGTPGEDPNRLRYGVMAQDLQKTPMGASMVDETPRGKVINPAKAAGVHAAALADLHHRVKALETPTKIATSRMLAEDPYAAPLAPNPYAYGGRR